MTDYGVVYPISDADGEVATEDEVLRVAGRPITPRLADALLAWQRLFDEHFHWERGWCSVAARDEYATEAPRLRDHLQTELSRDVDVVLDLWPLPGDPRGSEAGEPGC